MREDPERTEGIRRRDPAVLQALVREQLPRLLRAARGAGLEPDAAEDAVQGTFLVFLRRAEGFDGRARAGTYLFGILFRKIAETRRALARETAHDDIDAVVEQRFDETGRWTRPPEGPEEILGRREVLQMLAGCLDEVPERQRTAFVLREVEGLTTEEICKVLEVSSNNLGVLLFRARHRLRECLERKGLEGSRDVVL